MIRDFNVCFLLGLLYSFTEHDCGFFCIYSGFHQSDVRVCVQGGKCLLLLRRNRFDISIFLSTGPSVQPVVSPSFRFLFQVSKWKIVTQSIFSGSFGAFDWMFRYWVIIGICDIRINVFWQDYTITNTIPTSFTVHTWLIRQVFAIDIVSITELKMVDFGTHLKFLSCLTTTISFLSLCHQVCTMWIEQQWAVRSIDDSGKYRRVYTRMWWPWPEHMYESRCASPAHQLDIQERTTRSR